jgi:hypothetical protein
MAEVPISNLIQLTTPNDGDVYPVVSIANITQKIRYDTLYNDISSRVVVGKYTPITTFNDSQTFLSNASGNWQTAYTTVTANSAAWGAAAPIGYTLFREASSVISPNNGTNVYALSVYSLSANVDIALIAKGTGATLAQIPDNTATGGGKRGQYATDWQKIRTQATQVASGLYSVIAGGQNNTSSNDATTVGGGQGNIANYSYATVGGGLDNTANYDYAFVGGGEGNSAGTSGTHATVVGGNANQASGQYSFIGGGGSNTSSGFYSTVGGGHLNDSTSSYAFVGGGYDNTASGTNSTVVGGSQNNTNGKQNAHIIGSNITAPLSNYAYVNNLSTTGNITSNTAGVTTLTATNSNITNLTATNSIVTSFTATNSNITNLTATNSNITNLTATNALVTNLTAISTTSTTISAATYQGSQAIKAWVNFDGTGSGAGVPTIRSSYGINKIARINDGIFVVEFRPNTFTTSTYVIQGLASGNAATMILIDAASETGAPTLMTSLSCRVKAQYSPGTTSTTRTPHTICLTFMGD